MFLNDVCDVGFDRQYKSDRPIISGSVTRRQAGLAALVLLLAGVLLAATINPRALLSGRSSLSSSSPTISCTSEFHGRLC